MGHIWNLELLAIIIGFSFCKGVDSANVKYLCKDSDLPANMEVNHCFSKRDNDISCSLSCKVGYELGGIATLICNFEIKKWIPTRLAEVMPYCKFISTGCPYPPVLPKELHVTNCCKKNDKITKCEILCTPRRKYDFVHTFGEREIYCDFKSDQWIQRGSRVINTTCSREFGCASCNGLRCPKKAFVYCDITFKKCHCGCTEYNSCDGMKCPKKLPYSYCSGFLQKIGSCQCREKNY